MSMQAWLTGFASHANYRIEFVLSDAPHTIFNPKAPSFVGVSYVSPLVNQCFHASNLLASGWLSFTQPGQTNLLRGATCQDNAAAQHCRCASRCANGTPA